MRLAPWLLAATVAGVSSIAARPARACGGTFCDTGPRAMPVDQKGENILFAVGHGEVEAHIQIQYEGEASRFAWVLPVQALPQVEVGSEALFQNLLAGTVPRFALNSATCGGGGGVSTPRTSGSVAVDGGGGGTTVIEQKRVGSFDISVLSGGSATEVADWLSTNGYAIGPSAPALLASYVARHFLFVAVKLTGGAGIDSIHPLVVRFAGTEPCVPLELTAVAAVENMGVRTFFLGSRRVVPKNYKHVALNPVMLNWQSFAPNYDEVVGRAADAPVANGHAFVTEYAGSASVVSTAGLVYPQWDASAFVGAEPTRVIDILKQQTFAFCGGGTCSYRHPLILPLLRQFLPPPSGVDEGGFYACLACYAKEIDAATWGDGTGFARALEERVIVPGRRASDLLEAHTYLTRMFTTISPAEMTEDPAFEERDGLPPVGFTQTATLVTKCDDKRGVVLPDGREVGLARVVDPASPSASQFMWPTFTAEMPWAERVEEFTSTGAIALVDNGATIDRLLAEWNASVGWVTEGVDAGSRGGLVSGAGGSTVGSGAVGSGGGGSAGGGSGGGGAGPGLDPGFSAAGGSGCGCAVPGRAGDPRWGLGGALVAASAFARRRRSARRN